jgi:hypothetical protein
MNATTAPRNSCDYCGSYKPVREQGDCPKNCPAYGSHLVLKNTDELIEIAATYGIRFRKTPKHHAVITRIIKAMKAATN